VSVFLFFAVLTLTSKRGAVKNTCFASLEEASGMDYPRLMQVLGAHQHTLQYLRWWFQAKMWCLKFFFFFFKFVKVRQALELPTSDPSWPPTAGDSGPRPPPPCDLTSTYCTATKRFKFVALFEGFKEKILVKTFFFWRTHYTFGNILF